MAKRKASEKETVPAPTGTEYAVKFVVIDAYGGDIKTVKVTAESRKDAIKAGELKVKAENKDATKITFTGEIV